MGKIKIGLFGFGVVGQGIYEVVRKSKNANAEIVKICVRSLDKPRSIDRSHFTDSPAEILDNPEIDLIVEVIDDAKASYDIVKSALLKGIPVVSGNKTMLAHHLPEMIEIQKKHNVALLYDASSCGSIPVIRNLEEYYDNDLLLEVKGILNGSSNYILSRVFDHKDSYANALAQAQALGFAESDPSFDIGGYDYAFIQDQSQNPANYGRDATASILTGLTTLADKVRAASPSCKVILEETWTFSSASYGGFTDFPTFETYNDAGAKAMAKAAGTWVSPIGPAFRQVREGGSGINLYYSDSKHQSEYGAYLKACVNYLVLFGERFGADPADCGLNPDKAAYLRSVAEQIVLGNEGDYFIER